MSEAGLTLRLARIAAPRGRRFDLAFRVVDRRGRTVRGFDVTHEKRMHLIVVRRDTTAFQHVHPAPGRDGTWSVPVTLRDAGSYRVFADFSVGGRARTRSRPTSHVDGVLRSRPLPPPATTADVDGLHVALAERPAGPERVRAAFTVTRDGEPVAVEPYLGAQGPPRRAARGRPRLPARAPRRGRRPTFMATFPTAGPLPPVPAVPDAEGRVHTAAFTQEVAR